MKFFKYTWLLLIIVLVSCTEQFKDIDPKNLNAKLKRNNHIQSPTDLVVAFDTLIVRDQRLSVTSEDIGNDQLQITAIHKITNDDELSAEKYVFIAEHQKGLWKVLEIRYNWKCWPGYGHTDWGI